MEIKATLKPGLNGTKTHLDRYGDQLVCVRYRYDKKRQKRLTTVELIVDKQDWVAGVIITPDKQVSVKIDYGESELREKVKAAGAWWDKKRKVWTMSYKSALQLGLEHRIDDELGF